MFRVDIWSNLLEHDLSLHRSLPVILHGNDQFLVEETSYTTVQTQQLDKSSYAVTHSCSRLPPSACCACSSFAPGRGCGTRRRH